MPLLLSRRRHKKLVVVSERRHVSAGDRASSFGPTSVGIEKNAHHCDSTHQVWIRTTVVIMKRELAQFDRGGFMTLSSGKRRGREGVRESAWAALLGTRVRCYLSI